MNRHSLLPLATLQIFYVGFAVAQSPGVNDSHGKVWRQLTETTGVSWNQLSQVCPRDGLTPCSGLAGGRDLTGWVWATGPQVTQLFGYYEPAVLASPTSSVSGFNYFFTASTFLSAFRPTESVALTYSASQFAAGWTASTDAAYLPIAGSVGTGTTPVSISGGFGIGPVSNPAEITSFRGAFLFRDTGLGNNAVNAYDDAGQVPSPAGGTAVANVLANDWVAGAPATLANVNMTQESSTSPGVTLDLADGSVDVAPGTTATTHTLIYKICAKANPANCDGAAVRVTVPPYVVKAVNDTGSISPAVGGSAIASVLSNDTVGSARATTANVTVVQISSTSGGVTLDPSDGSVDVAIGTANGTYSLLYRICEIANPSNCDQATATVTVIPNVVDAVDDSARASSKTGGVAIATVLVNDKVGTARATAATVRLSMVSSPIPGITLDVNTGAVLVAPKTQSGLYSFVYQICEIVSPANCDRATVALDLSGK